MEGPGFILNDRQCSHSRNHRESLLMDPKFTAQTSVGLLIEQAMSKLKWDKDRAVLKMDWEKSLRAQRVA